MSLTIRYAIVAVFVFHCITSTLYGSFRFISHYPYITPVSFDFFIHPRQRLVSTRPAPLMDLVFSLRTDQERTVHASNTSTNTLQALRWAIKSFAFIWPVASPLMAIFDAPRDRVRREVVPLPLPFTPFLEQCVLNPEVQRDT